MIDFNTVRQYNFPTVVRFGAGAVNELPAHLAANGLEKVLLVTDPNVAHLDFFKRIKESLQLRNISTEVFSDIHKNPVKSDVLKGGMCLPKRTATASSVLVVVLPWMWRVP